MVDKTCVKCGEKNKRLFRHHISYTPEKIILVCMSCHRLIHNKINRSKKCHLSVKKIKELSNKSVMRNIHKNSFVFAETLIQNIRLLEDIRYNNTNGEIIVNSYFHANVGKHILYLSEE